MLQSGLDPKLLLSLMIGVLMGALDLTILAPALPYISDSFSVTPSAVVLAFSIYAAFYAVSVPVMSKLADVRGYQLVYGTSMALFAGGSAAAALAPTLPLLIVARVVQGIGGGGLFPVAQAIVGAVLPPEKRSRALSVLVATFAVGGLVGPNLGGYLVQQLSWHWIFWINVPLGALGVLLFLSVDLPEQQRDEAIDWGGAVLVAVTFGSLVLGIEGLRDLRDHGFFSLEVGGLFTLSLLGLALLIPVERRQREPILAFGLITSAAVAPLLLVSLLVGYALLSSVLFIPIYMQLLFNASAFGSGAVLNAAAVGLGLSSWVAGAYTARFGVRRFILVGMACTALGPIVMILFQHSLEGILVGLVFVGAGLGLAQGPISDLALTVAPDKDRGQISGLISITRSLGGATGITLAGVLLSRASQQLARAPGDLAQIGSQAWGSSTGLEVLRRAPAATQETVRQVLGAGIVQSWYWAAGAALLGFLIAFSLRAHPAAEDRHAAAGS